MADTTVQVEVNIREAVKDELLDMLGGTPQEALAAFQSASVTVLRAYWKKRIKHHREEAVSDEDPLA